MIPYPLYTNQTINPSVNRYGLRICAFNNSAIENPFATNWTRSNDQSVSAENLHAICNLCEVLF